MDYGRQSDEEDKSSVWTDEDEHVLWKAMTLPQRFKHVNASRRKLAWHVEAQTASLQDGLQPEAQNDQLPADMLCFLQECNLMKLSHPQRKEIGKRCVGNSGEFACKKLIGVAPKGSAFRTSTFLCHTCQTIPTWIAPACRLLQAELEEGE